MATRRIQLDDLGKDFNIEEPEDSSDSQGIYCGKVGGTTGNLPLSRFRNISTAVCCFIITVTVLLVSSYIWGFGSHDWDAFDKMRELIRDIISSIRIK